MQAHSMYQAQNQEAPDLVPQQLLEHATALLAQEPGEANISE